jgi:transposase
MSRTLVRALLRRTKQITRRKFSAEEKIRILLEGIHPTVYYDWLKAFMEAGKARMRGDSPPDATTAEVHQLKGRMSVTLVP